MTETRIGTLHKPIHIKRHPNKIKLIEIKEAWMPTVKKLNSRRPAAVRKWTYEETTSARNNNEDRNPPITAYHRLFVIFGKKGFLSVITGVCEPIRKPVMQ